MSDSIDDAGWFDLDVACDACAMHHVVRVAPVAGGMQFKLRRGSPLGSRTIEYTCPRKGVTEHAEFTVPPGFDWPFKVVEVE